MSLPNAILILHMQADQNAGAGEAREQDASEGRDNTVEAVSSRPQVRISTYMSITSRFTQLIGVGKSMKIASGIFLPSCKAQLRVFTRGQSVRLVSVTFAP